MFTLEEKMNIVLKYIAYDDDCSRAECKKMAAEALQSEESTTLPGDISNVDDMIYDLLKEIGIPTNLTGYRYLIHAIKLVIADSMYAQAITHRLYFDVAAKYNTTAARAERVIRHAIEAAFNRSDMDSLISIFGNRISMHKGKLTNSQFITACADKIAREMKKLGIKAV